MKGSGELYRCNDPSAVDLYEMKEAVGLKAALPGCDPEELDSGISEDSLTTQV